MGLPLLFILLLIKRVITFGHGGGQSNCPCLQIIRSIDKGQKSLPLLKKNNMKRKWLQRRKEEERSWKMTLIMLLLMIRLMIGRNASQC